MSVRDVQFLEVVEIILYLRAFHHLVAHAYEDPLHFFQSNGVGMAVAHQVLLRRKGHVDHFPLHLLFPDRPVHLLLALLQGRFDLSSCVVDHLSDLGTVLRGHILHTF